MTPDLSKPLVLVAEDDEITSAITVKTLENAGYNVISAINGQEAIELCIKAHPQLVLMDAAMPKLDGFEACRHIKYSTDDSLNTISVMMVTALEDDDAIDKAFAAGAEDYITKPVNWHILEHRLNVLVQKVKAENALRENEARFQAIAESASDAIISVDYHGDIIFWNQAAARIFAYSKQEILGKSAMTLIPKELRIEYAQMFKNAKSSDSFLIDNKIHQFSGLKKDGSVFPLELSLSAWIINKQRYYSCILRDISQRLQEQKELKKLSMAVRQSPNLVIMSNLDGVIEYANPQIKNMTGYEYDDVIGQNMSMLYADEQLYQELWQTINQGNIWSGTLQNKKKNGQLYWAKESISPIFDEQGLISHFIGIQEDVTEAKTLSEEIAYRATHDPLTGLVNRQEFEIHLQTLIDKSDETDSHALCFIDLDRFKMVNDTAGHLAGDELLRQLSKQMKTVGRKQDLLARLGGDEFVLILSHCEQFQALQIAEKLHNIINDFQLHWDDNIFKVGASIGLASATKGDDAIQVLRFADIACYAAKNTGRNKVYVFDENDKEHCTQSVENHWINRIEQALQENEFRLYMQPIISLINTDSLYRHCEILLRLIDEDGSIMEPDAFFPAAERFNLAAKIDCWVIEHALEWFSHHPEKLNELESFSINLSSQSLNNYKLQGFISSLVSRLQFPTEKLIFEIAETAAINNFSQAKLLISGLQTLGIRFSLDNFGKGISSFAYLKNLPVEFLKIDGIFIKDIANDCIDFEMTKSIKEIAHMMGKKVIAKFVENQQTLDILSSMNIDYAQGYHYSKPVPLE